MGFFDTALGSLTKAKNRHENKNFKSAFEAVTAVASMADKVITQKEKTRTVGFINRCEHLEGYDINEVITGFNKIVESLEFDWDTGLLQVSKSLRAMRDNREDCILLAKIAKSICAEDKLEPGEEEVLRWICSEFNIEFDVLGIK